MGVEINKKDLIEQTLPEFFFPGKDPSNLNKKLLVELFLPPDDQLKKDAFVFFCLWSASLNYEYYIKEYFPGVLFEVTVSDDVSFENQREIKRDFTKKEIEGINSIILDLTAIFKRYEFTANPRFISAFLKKGMLEPENETFLNILKKEDIELVVLEPLIKNRLAEIGKMDLFYILAVIYMDLYKIHQFLNSNYDNISDSNKKIRTTSPTSEAPQIKPISKDAKIFNTVWEAVLFQAALVGYSGKYSRTKKEIPDLIENMLFPDGKNISPNTFYQKLQNIDNASKGISHPKHGKYTEKDYIAVENRLLKEKPEAIFKLKEKYFYEELY
jgi:hypothetical protein